MPNISSAPLQIFMLDWKTYCFQHLEPFVIEFQTQHRPDGVRIKVQFSDHCYSEKFEDSVHNEMQALWDKHKKKRAFDYKRYELSLALPAMVNALPTAKVFATSGRRNYFHIGERIDGLEGEYRMYFSLKIADKMKDVDLRMFVESAYSLNENKVRKISRDQKVRFAVLADKFLKGEKINRKYKK